MTYSIYRQHAGKKILRLWDSSPERTLKATKALLKKREKQHPEHKFFIARD
jgi:hypothetical protein